MKKKLVLSLTPEPQKLLPIALGTPENPVYGEILCGSWGGVESFTIYRTSGLSYPSPLTVPPTVRPHGSHPGLLQVSTQVSIQQGLPWSPILSTTHPQSHVSVSCTAPVLTNCSGTLSSLQLAHWLPPVGCKLHKDRTVVSTALPRVPVLVPGTYKCIVDEKNEWMDEGEHEPEPEKSLLQGLISPQISQY